MKSAATFLMFEGQAEAAMTFYAAKLPDARILHIERYGPDGPGPEGSVISGAMEISGHKLMFFDSFMSHDFTFTPAISLFIDCDSREELNAMFAALSEGGQVLMPLDTYPFARCFGWVQDPFGVSWQMRLD